MCFHVFTPAFNLPQSSDHIFECPHPFLTLTVHFQVVSPIFDLWLSSSVWTCCHILLTTLERLNIFLTTNTHSRAPPPIFKLNRSFSTNFTLFDYFHLFLTIFTLFLIEFTRSQSLLFIFRSFLVNFDCSCLNLSVTAYFLINFICFWLFLTNFNYLYSI